MWMNSRVYIGPAYRFKAGLFSASRPRRGFALKLPKRTQDLIDALDDAAQDYGWQIDQGSAEAASESTLKHGEAKRKLEQHILRLLAKSNKDAARNSEQADQAGAR